MNVSFFTALYLHIEIVYESTHRLYQSTPNMPWLTIDTWGWLLTLPNINCLLFMSMDVLGLTLNAQGSIPLFQNLLKSLRNLSFSHFGEDLFLNLSIVFVQHKKLYNHSLKPILISFVLKYFGFIKINPWVNNHPLFWW